MSHHHKRATPARAWAGVREQVLEHDNYTCRTCGAYGNEVDHVQPLSAGGAATDPANLQTLCRGCHIEKTVEENGPPDHEREAWAEYMKQERQF